MDASVLESVRPFFQGLPAPAGAPPTTSAGSTASLPSQPGAATPVQPQHGFPTASAPSTSPSALAYWQRPKDSAKSPALASPLHHVYNGKLGEPLQPSAHQPAPESLRHNLPPIAALSTYPHARSVLREAQGQGSPHLPLPSINQITPLTKSSTPSLSPRTTHQDQFRTPEYPQSNHHSIYSPNPSSNQSHSRSSSYQSQPQPQTQGSSKQHSAPSSPASSSSSPHAYSYSPRTSLPTTASSPVYNQTSSTSSTYVSPSHHQRQPQPQQSQQSRPPSNPTHHPMSPVIQQPNQPEHLLKLHQQQPQYPQHQLPAHSPYSSSQQHPSSHNSQSHQHALYISHQSQQQSSSQSHLMPSQHQQHSQHQKQQQPSVLQLHSSSHHQHSSSPQQYSSSHQHHSSSHQLHSSSPQQHSGGPQHHSSSHQQLLGSSQQRSSSQQSHSSAHQQLSSSSQQHLSSLQHHSSSLQQLSSNIHQHSSTLQQLSSSVHQHSSNIQQHSNVQQKSSNQHQNPSYLQQSTGHHSSQSQPRHQHSSSQQLPHHSSSQQRHQGFTQYKTQHQQGQTQAARSQHLLTQQQHQLQQQTNLYNQSVQQSESDQLTEMLRIKEHQLAVAQAQQQAYYAAASSSSSTRPSSRPTTIEANSQQQTTTTQALTTRVKRESPLDLSVKTVRQSADSTAKDDSESLYLANFHIQEPSFQHRSKLPIQTASPRSSTLLPSLQLPSTVVYPHFDHPSNQTASSGAPKVDFLPNFQAHHGPPAGKSANFQEPSKRQTKISVSQLPSPQYPSHLASLPHMATFKKSSLPSAAYDDPNKQSQYYPTTSLPNTQRPTTLSNHSSLNLQSSHAAAQSNHYPVESSKRRRAIQYDYLKRRNSSSSSHSSISSESNYYPGKRQSSSDLKQPLPPKIPRVVDTWRQTIDQQIEQRLNSYASSRGHQVNGTTKENSSESDVRLHHQNIPPISPSSSLNIQTPHVGITLPSSDLSSRSLHSSHPPSSSSKFEIPSQYYPHNQLQYPSLNIPSRSSNELYNNLAQVKIPNLPSNGTVDKRVLSILRKRLDARDATNQLIQQQTEAAQNQERSKMYSSLGSRIYPQSMIVPSPILASQCKPPEPTPIARHNLPPFNALNLERSTSMPYPTQKLHIPKAMDSVAPEHAQSNIMPRNDLVPRSSPLPSHTEVISKPGGVENNGDFDGMTAYLAARIRTKAELKQVGPSVEQQRPPTVVSESNSSAQSPRTTPAIFSPPPSLHVGYPYPAVPGDLSKGTPTSESDRASSSGQSNCSPTKSFRERYSNNSPRRKLFCKPEDEQSIPSEGVIQARERGLRSSSETSVFDFRESDSDGETASERQSLHEMRKDRDRRLQEKHQNIPASSLDPSSDLVEINDTEPIDDSFWSGMCDKFVHQLQKGGMKVRKKGRQRKWKYIPIELEDPDPEWECNFVPEPPSNILVSEKENITIEKDTDLISKKEKPQEEPIDVPIEKDIKKDYKQRSLDNPSVEFIVPQKDENIATLKVTVKEEEESSDEDVPLSLRQTELKKEKEAVSKIEENSIDNKTMLSSECSETFVKLEKLSKEDIKKGLIKQESIPKTEASDSDADTSADESIESVAKRLRVRKPKEETSKTTRKTKPKEKENLGTPSKGGKKKKGEKKKSVFGDGTEFRPGWEAEVYRYKRSLRMPARLINIAGPQNWPRLSVSLPDLDPDSPMTLDSDISSLQNKQCDSDYESTPTKTKSKDRKNKTPQKKVEEKGEEDSFINRLIQRYGGKGKKSLRKAQEKESSKEKKGSKTIPQTNELKLLPTPSLDCIVKTPVKKCDQNTSQSKSLKGKKGGKLGGEPVDLESKDAVFLGYFRKKTVAEFRDAFAKHNGGFATEHELPPIMLKSRTRTQTRILTQRATIREVFGEDRPASAPPAGCREEENDKSVSDDKEPKKSDKKSKKLLNKLVNNSGVSVGTRTGLRSAAVLRSNKAVLKSKQHLLHGGERRKRDKDLIKSYNLVKKLKKDSEGIVEDSEIKLEDQEEPENKVQIDIPVLSSEKRLKYRSVRRKLKSSGFDYIRKKKKQQQKKEGEVESIKDKKKATPPKPVLESEEDIQNEIKGWVINKGLGETVLHRAARLGYTDIAAYCLEKMEHNASPRDNAGYTPLHEACSKGRLDIARLLLQYGADPSDSAQGGIRPLHEASEHGCLEMIRLLLSYGADPLLATYSGHTPLSLASHHHEARALLQNHLADVQGLPCVPWPIQELTDPALLGNDPMADAPSPEPGDTEMEIECAELSLPNLYQLLGEHLTDRWVLFQELGPILRVKTREALIKQLGPSHRNDFRDLKMTEFYNMARCCTVLGVGDHTLNPKAHKVTLVKYSDRVRALLNSETVIVR